MAPGLGRLNPRMRRPLRRAFSATARPMWPSPITPRVLPGKGLNGESVPMVSPLLCQDVGDSLGEVEDGEQDVLGQGQGVNTSGVCDEDRALPQTSALDHLADPRRGELDPSQPGSPLRQIRSDRTVDVEENLGSRPSGAPIRRAWDSVR